MAPPSLLSLNDETLLRVYKHLIAAVNAQDLDEDTSHERKLHLSRVNKRFRSLSLPLFFSQLQCESEGLSKRLSKLKKILVQNSILSCYVR